MRSIIGFLLRSVRPSASTTSKLPKKRTNFPFRIRTFSFNSYLEYRKEEKEKTFSYFLDRKSIPQTDEVRKTKDKGGRFKSNVSD